MSLFVYYFSVLIPSIEDNVQHKVVYIQIFLLENRQFCLSQREAGYSYITIKVTDYRKKFHTLSDTFDRLNFDFYT